MDNKILQHKLKCKLCQNGIQDYDIDLYTNQSEYLIYAEIQNKLNITFETLKEHKLFIPQLYTEKQLLDKIKNHDFSNKRKLISDKELEKNTKYMQKIVDNILWEEIPAIVDKIIMAGKSGKIKTNTLISILDKLISCSKRIANKDNILVEDLENLNLDADKGINMTGLSEENMHNTINIIKEANEMLKDVKNKN